MTALFFMTFLLYNMLFKDDFLGMKPPKPRGKPMLEDEDSSNFVKIVPKATKGKFKLTQHQKDKMTSRSDDIPALYSELSR